MPQKNSPSSHGFEIIEPPNELARRAGGFKAINIDHHGLEKTIARVARNYPEIAMPRLAQTRAVWNAIKAGEADPDLLVRLTRMALDFKGEGGSFGFPLVSAIAETLSLLCKHGDFTKPLVAEAVEAHLAAIEVVLAKAVSGDGGETGRAIVDGLRTAIRRISEPAP